MCALFGWLDYKGKVSSKFLQKLTQALANAAEERGTDAAGISYIKNGRITIYKRPKPAHKLHFHVPVETKAVMGHTRFTTQGNQKKNYNNRPFYGYADKTFSFAHNGILHNDIQLRKEKNLPATKIETDSYIAVQLLEQSGKLDFKSLKNMAETVEGYFTFTILDENNKLYFVKGTSPLYLIHFKKLGLYAYASTKNIMQNALKSCRMHRYQYTIIPVDNSDILSINSQGNIETSTFCTAFSDYKYFRYSNTYNINDIEIKDSQLDTILEMCSCFGVDEDTVLELLDAGYSYDDIECFFINPSDLQEELNAMGEF